MTTKSRNTMAEVLSKHLNRRDMDGLARLVDAPCPHSFTERVRFLLSLCVKATPEQEKPFVVPKGKVDLNSLINSMKVDPAKEDNSEPTTDSDTSK